MSKVLGTTVALLTIAALILLLISRGQADEEPRFVDLGRALPQDTRILAAATTPDGTLFLGTSYLGKLISYKDGFQDRGRAVEGTTAINCLVMGGDGRVYGGTNSGGQLFAYSPYDGRYSRYGQALPGISAVRALAMGEDGTLFGGVEPGGRIFSFNPLVDEDPVDRGQPVPGQNAVVALAKGPEASLWGVSSPSGKVFVWEPSSGSTEVASLGQEPVGLVVRDDSVYVGSASGHLFRVYRSGKVEDLGPALSGETRIVSLIQGQEGHIYGGTYPGGRIFSYEGLGQVVDLGAPVEGESGVYALAWVEGLLYGGTGAEGHIFRRLSPGEPSPTPSTSPTSTPTKAALTPTPTASVSSPVALTTAEPMASSTEQAEPVSQASAIGSPTEVIGEAYQGRATSGAMPATVASAKPSLTPVVETAVWVSREGSVADFQDGTVEVEFGVGAVTETVELFYTSLAGENSYHPAGAVVNYFSLDAKRSDGEHLKDLGTGAVVRLKYDLASVEDLDEGLLSLYYFEETGSAWQAVPVTRNDQKRTVAGMIKRTGLYAVVAPFKKGTEGEGNDTSTISLPRWLMVTLLIAGGGSLLAILFLLRRKWIALENHRPD